MTKEKDESSKEEKSRLEELFEGYEGSRERGLVDWGEPQGKERFWETRE